MLVNKYYIYMYVGKEMCGKSCKNSVTFDAFNVKAITVSLNAHIKVPVTKINMLPSN